VSTTAPVTTGMVLVPSGEFVQGSEEFDLEAPSHRIHLPAFWIDRYPVTNEQYLGFVRATGHPPPPDWPDGRPPEGRLDHPVERVSWHDAVAFASWAGKRLPTEAEWEKAARGKDARRWPWGNAFDESRCIVWDHAMALDVTTVPVTAHPEGASPYGVEQMAGNVEEWVADELLPYPGSSHRSPSAGGGLRVVRGGSWFYTQEHARCAYRRGLAPDFTGWSQAGGPGFRCALDAG
jgi:formylglycine-generating enzyme required for sulfatase activity